jgi:hypothetical protein
MAVLVLFGKSMAVMGGSRGAQIPGTGTNKSATVAPNICGL